jgi:hypothetical protein
MTPHTAHQTSQRTASHPWAPTTSPPALTYTCLQVFQDLGVLTAEEVETAVTTTYPGVRLGVARGPAYSVGGVMDCGVSPHRLLEAVTR